MPAFKPNPQYVRELKKYGVIPRDFDLARQPLDYFAADQAYWRSLWRTVAQALKPAVQRSASSSFALPDAKCGRM